MKKFGQLEFTPVSHQFAAWSLNGAGRPLVRAELSGGVEDLLYLFDALDEKSELLGALRKSKMITDRQYLTILSDQPIGRDRKEAMAPRFILTDVDLAVTAPGGDDLVLSATETFSAVEGRTGVLLLDLYDTKFGRDALDPHHLRVKGVFDEAGTALPFDHRKNGIAVGLAKPISPGSPSSFASRSKGTSSTARTATATGSSASSPGSRSRPCRASTTRCMRP